MKKRNKIISIVLLSLLVIVGVSASLLVYFGRITTTAEVEQAVTLLGSPTHEIPESAPDGEEFCYLHKLDNKASVDIDVGFETDCYAEGQDSCEEITTIIYGIPETRTLHLESKNSGTWQVDGRMTATLEFDPVNPIFTGTLTTTGLKDEWYSLIYYRDDPDRFDDWNGEGGIVILTFKGNLPGMPFNVNLDSNLPIPSDWNVNPIPDYCNNHNGFDSYAHCKGAKLWIVTANDLIDSYNSDGIGDSLPLVNWNPTEWLFETDLITYFDCNETIEDFAVDMEITTTEDGIWDPITQQCLPQSGSPGFYQCCFNTNMEQLSCATGQPLNSITTLTTESRAKTPMLVCYNFPIGTIPGIYTLITDIIPQ